MKTLWRLLLTEILTFHAFLPDSRGHAIPLVVIERRWALELLQPTICNCKIRPFEIALDILHYHKEIPVWHC
jgi:hypothetical protein